ncbi:unnamed protein product [Diabrotica balteata]|uniref:Uncharacterized protein n=1 Tax=Diabrotica balteata TaxID=107213 RepID=A0A9P0GYG2_DIABA|nr:unnamed protein product [Diabrotica balteata]
MVVVLNRAVLKNSFVSLYLDGQQIHNQKMHYISQNPGGGAANLTVASSVYGYIGTPPAWRRYSRLCWKQGPCHLFEEVLPPNTVTYMYQLGLALHGLFSGSNFEQPRHRIAVTEEKVVFGLNAKAVSQLTLNKIRKVYSRTDNKSIAKQLGMSSHESATPIRILHNSAGHLAGSARTLRGSYYWVLGSASFLSKPVSYDNRRCGRLLGTFGTYCDGTRYRKLVCRLWYALSKVTKWLNRRWIDDVVTKLWLCCSEEKELCLNSHILHLAFSLVGTVDSGRESSAIPNRTAFQDLLCDLEVWYEAPGELLRSHLEHLYELAAESNEKRTILG